MRSSPLHQLFKTGQIDKIDEMASASVAIRQIETSARGVGHVLVSVDPASELAYTAVITTEAGTATLGFDPDSPAARLLHSVGVTKIPATKPVSAYIPADVAIQLARMAERPA